jgi:hypothetical protein
MSDPNSVSGALRGWPACVTVPKPIGEQRFHLFSHRVGCDGSSGRDQRRLDVPNPCHTWSHAIEFPICHTIGAAELALIKLSTNLINLARRGIVDHAALAAALKNKQIAAAGRVFLEARRRFTQIYSLCPTSC